MTMDALYATNVPSQSPASNGDPLTLDTTQLTEGTSITHTGGASDINITESGVYLISYSTVATNTTSAGTASVQLEENGTAIPGSVTDHHPEYGRNGPVVYQHFRGGDEAQLRKYERGPGNGLSMGGRCQSPPFCAAKVRQTAL